MLVINKQNQKGKRNKKSTSFSIGTIGIERRQHDSGSETRLCSICGQETTHTINNVETGLTLGGCQ